MTTSGFFRFWKRFFRNRSSATFIFNPYAATETTSDGKIKRQRPKVTYVQILYDLFIVAALQIFSRETALVTGDQIASFIAFFTIMWSIWASQSLFDLHFRSGHDLFSLFFLLLQLCMFGGLASIGAGFNIATGILHFEHNLPAGVYQWVVAAEPELIDESDRRRAVQAASAIYAISRFILIVQYAIVSVQARRRKCEIRPMLMVIAGLFISAAMWLGALGCDFQDGKSWAIGRLCLWISGVLCEFGLTFWALKYEAHFEEDAEFFLERFNALTIIIIGEGVFGLFEGFSIVIQGPQETIDPSVIGVLCAAICMYLSLYYLYFGHKLETFRSFTGSKLVWGFMHYPMHLCLLLTFQAINYNIQCIATMDPIDNVLTAGLFVTIGLQNLTQSNNNTSVAEMLEFAATSTDGGPIAIFAAGLGVDWNATLEMGAYMVSGNTTKFFQYVNAQTYGLFTRLYSLARFKPTPSTFHAFDRLAQLGPNASDDAFNNYYQEGFYRLVKLTYEASLFGFATVGGYVLILAVLQWVQTPKLTKFTTISIVWKTIIGVASICMEVLTHKGFTFAGWNSDDYTDNVSELSNLISNTPGFVPAMLAVSLPIIAVDSALYLWRHALLDAEREAGTFSVSHSPEALDDKHGFIKDHDRDSSQTDSRTALHHLHERG